MTTMHNLRDIGFCLSTDTKPTSDVDNGTMIVEMDTGKVYFFNKAASAWAEWASETVNAWLNPVAARFLFFASGGEDPVFATLYVNEQAVDYEDGLYVNSNEITKSVISINGTKYDIAEDE